MARHTIAYFLRRRIVLVTVLATSLLVLFLVLQHTLRDIDELGVHAASYIPFELPSPLPLQFPHKASLTPVRDLPAACLESHFALGQPCHEIAEPLDVLWTWVNGSDILLDEAKRDAQARYAPDDPYRPTRSTTQARLYRDHDELRYSMRSVLLNFGSYTSHFRLVTADFPYPQDVANGSNITSPELWRLGQVPQWLDMGKRTESGVWRDGAVDLAVTHHAQIFSPYNGTNFNSLAIESQFGHLQNMSEYFIYMNDDLFMMNPMSPVSFYTPAFGVVLHLQSNLLVKPERLVGNHEGEWRSLGESNYLLSKRFGSRHRPYVAHEAKTASRKLLQEMEAIWPDSFASSATHLFRETQAGDGDVNAMFMHSHYVVERAREALLWSWIVGRVGGENDVWGEKEAMQAWAELGGVWGENDLLVKSGYRETLVKSRVEKVLADSGLKPQTLTSYVFSSLDGYPYSGLGVSGAPDWLKFSPDMDEGLLPRCRISYAECFVVEDWEGDATLASEIFKNIAFRHQRCGDCVIMALVQASGPLGLSAFLPPRDRTLASRIDLQDAPDAVVPHLPLVDDWQDGDFSLQEVASSSQEVNVRDWTLQLLQRYRYVIGDTPSMFERISTPRQTAIIINRIEKTPKLGLLCINDDVARLDNEVAQVLKYWFQRRWGRRSAWER